MKEYHQLKDITPKAIFDISQSRYISVGYCFMKEFIRFVHVFDVQYDETLSFEDLVWELEFENETKWTEWLIKHGFIEEVLEEITYAQGDDLINNKGEKAVLAQVDLGQKMSIITTSEFDKGNRWHHPVSVNNISNITAKEFKSMNGSTGTWRKDK